MRLLLSLLLILALPVQAEQRPSLPMDACAVHMPYGIPQTKKTDTTQVCREGYALEHDNRAKIPAWVAYTLTPTTALGCAERERGFESEKSVRQDARAQTKDYSKSGYDMGHMASSADMRLTEQLSDESNVLSNVAPQLPTLNRLAWKTLETRTRSWVLTRENPLLIYVGPIYSLKFSSRIGSGVVVPAAFFKIIIDQKTLNVMAFIYPQKGSRAQPSAFLTSVAEVQRQSGLVLPLPKDYTVEKETWPITASSVKEKAVACQ